MSLAGLLRVTKGGFLEAGSKWVGSLGSCTLRLGGQCHFPRQHLPFQDVLIPRPVAQAPGSWALTALRALAPPWLPFQEPGANSQLCTRRTAGRPSVSTLRPCGFGAGKRAPDFCSPPPPSVTTGLNHRALQGPRCSFCFIPRTRSSLRPGPRTHSLPPAHTSAESAPSRVRCPQGQGEGKWGSEAGPLKLGLGG